MNERNQEDLKSTALVYFEIVPGQPYSLTPVASAVIRGWRLLV
jgi:hypothetical protein